MNDPHDMRCDEVVELVTELVEGALDAETEHRVVAHLSLCDGCQAYVEQVRRAVEALGDPPPAEPPALRPETRDALLAAFRESSR
ncbi:zf-HC2 domain-containing protein [Actinoplanes sp. NPDC051633]|uniref:anti-sigma factor family protein n=1 Tax=Actinoplanes sp. NPDC051633 TaxID=3155670 RepID=UPI0034233224